MYGLVIRYFMGGFYICDGKPLKGHEDDDELWIGNTVKWFESFDEAKKILEIIDQAYGKKEEPQAARLENNR
jgi:hypothetical protein